MRKTILFSMMMFLITSFLLPSCSKDDEPTINIPSSISVNVGSSYNFGVEGDWSSSNDFVASVSNKGVVNGEHVGDCDITVGNKRCKVSVKGTINLYIDPITEWGMSKSMVIAKWGEKDYIDTGDNIGYTTGNTNVPLIAYNFENGKLAAAIVMVSTNYTSKLIDYLLERYESLGIYDNDFFFINNYTLQSATTVIGVQLYNVDYWEIIYMPNTYTKSREIDKSDIENDLNILMSLLD